MATRFEIVLHSNDPARLRAAAEEALDEIQRLESRLSIYRPDSELTRLNTHAAFKPVKVEPGLFRLLQYAQQLHNETQGAFDITVAPLVRCWGFMGGSGKLADPDELAVARSNTGMELVELNEADFTVKFARPGVMIDLGAIGKGYAIDSAVELLRDAGITSAFIHGGTSTVYAIGSPPDSESWNVSIRKPCPANYPHAGIDMLQTTKGSQSGGLLAVIPLRNESLSLSAVWGKSFQADGAVYGHVMNPRLGRPVAGGLMAAVALSSATDTDAFSTALLAAASAGHDSIASLRRGMKTLLVECIDASGNITVKSQGIRIHSDADQNTSVCN